METIIEAFPFVFGLLLGATCLRFSGRVKIGIWLIGSLALGALATVASGEYKISPLYFLFDIGLVGIASRLTIAFLEWRRRRYRSHS